MRNHYNHLSVSHRTQIALCAACRTQLDLCAVHGTQNSENLGLRHIYQTFFERHASFTLGVCNGCQIISQLKDLIPGASAWPAFKRNRSEQFEARAANVEILKSSSLFFSGMEGSLLPIPVAHGEGRADFSCTGDLEACKSQNLRAMRYIDGQAKPASTYPQNTKYRGLTPAPYCHSGQTLPPDLACPFPDSKTGYGLWN